jgi:hypothetical protein
MHDDGDEIDNTCERLIRLAMAALEASRTRGIPRSKRRSKLPLSVST